MEKDYKKLAEAYNPDKSSYLREEEKFVKEQMNDLKQFNLKGKKEDKESQNIRNKELENGKLEKRITKAIKSFTPEEVTLKYEIGLSFGNVTSDINEFKQAEEAYNKGTLGKLSEQELNDKANDLLKVAKHYGYKDATFEEAKERVQKRYDERYKKTFDNYEILEIHRDNENGFAAYTLGNKNTGKVETFFCGTSTENFLTEEGKAIARAEQKGNKEASTKVSMNQKAATKYLEDLYQRSENGFTGKTGKVYKELDCVIGQSKGASEAVYGVSQLKHGKVRCLANDPGPIAEIGNYFDNHAILVTVPNNGVGAYNYTQKIPGSSLTSLYQTEGRSEGKGNNKTTLIPALAVPRSGSSTVTAEEKRNEEKERKAGRANMRNHYPDAKGAGLALYGMQQYVNQIEPKLDAFIESKKQEKTTNKMDKLNPPRKDLAFELKDVKKNVQQENNAQEKQKVNVQGR